jgi:MSHA biogenesis protein MshL
MTMNRWNHGDDRRGGLLGSPVASLTALLAAAALVWALPAASSSSLTSAAAEPGATSSAAAPAPAWDSGLAPVTIVTSDWADVREILRSVAASAGLGLQLAPDVKGQVNVHLENVTVGRALASLCDPVDLGWEVVEGTLIVYRRGMVTRWFTFDYPVTQRQGRGELQISAARQSESGGGGGGGENQNKSNLTSTATMSIWPEVMRSLQTVVFEGALIEDASSGDGENLALSVADDAGRSLVINPMASLVQVTAEWDRVQKVDQLLARLKESLHRQVSIQVRIMEVALDDDSQAGVNWQTFLDGDVQFGQNTLGSPASLDDGFVQMVVNTSHLTGVMAALATSGDLHTVSTPRVTTLNNQKAIVRIVREDVYFLASVQPAVVSNGVATEPVISYLPQTVPVGVVLDVTPQVGHDRIVTLNVHPTISDVVAVAVSPNEDSAPVLSVRELDTVGKVGDGQTMVIAGLISERERIVRSGVPFLKDLPGLGLLFGRTSHEKYNVEMIMLLTPTIMDPAVAAKLAESAEASVSDKF